MTEGPKQCPAGFQLLPRNLFVLEATRTLRDLSESDPTKTSIERLVVFVVV